MPLSIKNDEVDRLVDEVVAVTGESKTETVRRALEERRAKLTLEVSQQDRSSRLRRFLESEVWPRIPEKERGRRLTAEEEESILGYGPAGV